MMKHPGSFKDLLETIDTKYKRKTKGIFLPNDTFANIMLNHLIQKYGCLPDDYKIIGFDDSPRFKRSNHPDQYCWTAD